MLVLLSSPLKKFLYNCSAMLNFYLIHPCITHKCNKRPHADEILTTNVLKLTTNVITTTNVIKFNHKCNKLLITNVIKF